MASTSRNMKERRLLGNEIELILDTDSEDYDEDSNETDMEEDDLTELLQIPPRQSPQGVPKQGRVTDQMNRGAQDHTPDARSDEDDQMTPRPLASEGVPKRRQLTDRPSKCVHQFSGVTPGKRQNMAPHMNKDSTPYSVFMLYFESVIALLVEETNRYYYQYLDTLDDGPSPLPDVTESEMFLAIII
jgi:hypothetical protein